MKPLQKHIIVVDSPSESGKTTLALHLATKYKFNYYHVKRWNFPIVGYEKELINFAFHNAHAYGSNFVIERLHLSEEAAANVEGHPSPYKDWKEFDQELRIKAEALGLKYELIMCLPPKESISELEGKEDILYDEFANIYKNNKDIIYKYDFTEDPDYISLDEYLESK
ncbi:MAG: hypothetical protein J5691_00410 [Bacilli bacterium]|nr:hypothetical protein [Bacilli bacterium]